MKNRVRDLRCEAGHLCQASRDRDGKTLRVRFFCRENLTEIGRAPKSATEMDEIRYVSTAVA